MLKEKFESKKGITLVALVITVIVLLILAGVTLSIVLNSGIINKSENAVAKYQDTSGNETDQINYLDAIFGNFLSNVTGASTSGGSSNPPAATYTVYTLGQEVIVGGENFFVIEENDSSSNSTITLISKYNLNQAGTAQAPNAANADTAVTFSSTNYWENDWIKGTRINLNNYAMPESENKSNNAIKKAQAYANSKETGATGKLLTYEEANEFTEKEADNITYKSSTMANIVFGKFNKQGNANEYGLFYWLGSASEFSYISVWYVEGGGENFIGSDGSYGVRPVITVSKSLVQLVQ